MRGKGKGGREGRGDEQRWRRIEDRYSESVKAQRTSPEAPLAIQASQIAPSPTEPIQTTETDDPKKSFKLTFSNRKTTLVVGFAPPSINHHMILPSFHSILFSNLVAVLPAYSSTPGRARSRATGSHSPSFSNGRASRRALLGVATM